MTRAFVAGATGLTGREVVRALCSRGIETHAHVRPDSSRLPEWRERFTGLGAQVDVTAWEEPAMAGNLSRIRPDILFGLLGTTRARGRQAEQRTGHRDTYETVDYALTVRLMRAAVAAGLRPRFVYLSAIGVSESSRGAYYAARFKTEQELRQSGLPFTIARPSLIVGERDDPRLGERVGAVAAKVGLGLAGALGAKRLRDRYAATSAEELASALVRLALDPAAENRVVLAEELR